jgi:phosphatidylinositol glycan class F
MASSPSPPPPANASAQSTTQGPATQPSAPPVSIVPSQLAKAYSFVHPVLLLALLATRFQALVADPVTELLNSLAPLVLLQLIYAIICLPPAGTIKHHASETVSPGGSVESDEKKKPAASASSGSAPATGTVLRTGKVGYRRRTPASKGSIVTGAWARLIVCLSFRCHTGSFHHHHHLLLLLLHVN